MNDRDSRSVPAFDDLRRGHVVLAPDPFRPEEDTTRPWVVVNNENHPFDKEQYVVMGMTTRTWYDERIPIAEKDYVHRRAPKDSSVMPHSVASLKPMLVTDYVCRSGTNRWTRLWRLSSSIFANQKSLSSRIRELHDVLREISGNSTRGQKGSGTNSRLPDERVVPHTSSVGFFPTSTKDSAFRQ